LQKLLLPIKGDITPVSFKLTPKRSGDHNIEISFYYKLNLLMILSASLHAIDLSPVVHVGSSKKYQFLHLDVVGSSDKGFESIIEIEKS
jgi:hypothetical protein